jgi:ElaB/YqjD/DUF883 family membrane-anchored ribosome-binding protein
VAEIAAAPEERLGHAAAPNMTLTENALLSGAVRQGLTKRGFIDWREVGTYAGNIDQIADSLAELLPDSAAMLVGLAEDAIKKVENALEQIDDSLELPAPQKTTKKEKAEASKSGIEFAGVIYKQSRAVLAVVERYVKDHPGSTVADVEKAFPETLLRRFGIVRTPDRAKSISSGPRYFYNNPVRCADGEVVVCTQFTSENIKPFIKHANEMGYTLTVIDRSSSSRGR